MSSRYSRARLVQWTGAACIFGVCLHFLYFSFTPKPKQDLRNSFGVKAPLACPQPPRAAVPRPQEGGVDKLAFLRNMVGKTKGYYVRDWSLGLGWNNMRYIIEASLMHATLLNRTLVLPSFVYARACEHNNTVCASYAYMVNRGDAIGWNDWRELPLEQQMGWRIPMEIMLNITHMRTKYNVITFHDYLDLHGLSRNIEWGSGAWDRNGYHNTDPRITLGVIPNRQYDPPEVIRVDVYPDTGKEIPVLNKENAARLTTAMGDKHVLDWEAAKKVVFEKTDEGMERAIKEAGWATLHTFEPFLGMEFVKSPVTPLKQVAPHSSVRGLLDEWGSLNDEVVLLEGEVHLNRKPGSLRFTTAAARDEYMRLCLFDLKYIDQLRIVADRAVERMKDKVGGRMWMSAQMRRGDFARLGWAMEHSIESHFERIQSRLKHGREILEELVKGQDQRVFEVPDVSPDPEVLARELPNPDDPFYLATDERSAEGLEWMKQHGAIFIGDLITFEDRQFAGWPLLVTDVLALVEQLVLQRSDYFYGHAMSSVAGGVVNMRAARGADPRTHLID